MYGKIEHKTNIIDKNNPRSVPRSHTVLPHSPIYSQWHIYHSLLDRCLHWLQHSRSRRRAVP